MKQGICAKTGSGTAAAVSTALGGVWAKPKLQRRKAAWMPLLFALILAVTMAACSGKAQAQSGGGNAGADLKQAADAVKGAAKEVKGAVSKAAAGKPAEASDFVYKLNKARNGVIITGIQKDARNIWISTAISGINQPVFPSAPRSRALSFPKTSRLFRRGSPNSASN